MATVITGTFQIVTDLAGGTGDTINLATSRAMRIVSILGTGVDNATITVSKVPLVGAPTACGVVTMENAAGGGMDSLVDQPGVMNSIADCTLLATDTLRIVRGVANSTRIVLDCVAAAGETVVES